MTLQINLLKKTERRYQGIVNLKVVVISCVGTLSGVTVLVLALAGISKVTLATNLDRARKEWARLDPVAAAVNCNSAAIAANQKTITEIESWGQGGSAAMNGVLRAVQKEIPAQIQLNSLFAGLKEDSFESKKLYYMLRLSGIAAGEMVAVEAKRKLNASDEVRGLCGELKLISSQRESGEKWSFVLEGRRLVGGGK